MSCNSNIIEASLSKPHITVCCMVEVYACALCMSPQLHSHTYLYSTCGLHKILHRHTWYFQLSLSLLNSCVLSCVLVLSELVCMHQCVHALTMYYRYTNKATQALWPRQGHGGSAGRSLVVPIWQCLGEGSGSYSRYPLLSRKAVSLQWCYMHCLY